MVSSARLVGKGYLLPLSTSTKGALPPLALRALQDHVHRLGARPTDAWVRERASRAGWARPPELALPRL